ncbi:MAG: DNA gyrase inhibitor YacG [Rhodopirellula sp.]|nr:DNA gyrase inhibitor YacG [Rhodopirellula sp.]
MAYRYTFQLKSEHQPEATFVVRLPSCPICKTRLAATAATESKDFPFCSARCREIDLLRWSDGKYAIVEPISADKLAEKIFDDELNEPLDEAGY